MAEGGRFKRLIGTSRTERWVTAGIVFAVVVAVAAFFALDTGDGAAPSGQGGGAPDQPATAPELRDLDEACLDSKLALAEAGAAAAERQGDLGDKFGRYGRQAAEVATAFAAEVGKAGLNGDAAASAAATQEAMASLAKASLRLADAADEGDPAATQLAFQEATTASDDAEQAIEQLGLVECGKLQVGLTRVNLGE